MCSYLHEMERNPKVSPHPFLELGMLNMYFAFLSCLNTTGQAWLWKACIWKKLNKLYTTIYYVNSLQMWVELILRTKRIEFWWTHEVLQTLDQGDWSLSPLTLRPCYFRLRYLTFCFPPTLSPSYFCPRWDRPSNMEEVYLSSQITRAL